MRLTTRPSSEWLAVRIGRYELIRQTIAGPDGVAWDARDTNRDGRVELTGAARNC